MSTDYRLEGSFAKAPEQPGQTATETQHLRLLF